MKVKSLSFVITALALMVNLTARAQDDPTNPWCLKGMECTAGEECPEPEDAPTCDKDNKTDCEKVPSPDTYGCNTGTAASCTKSQDENATCQSSNFSNECGMAECVYCEWDTDKKKCIMNGECSMGPCNTPCTAEGGGGGE